MFHPLYVPDIVRCVNDYLPIFQRLRSRRVCRTWHAALHDPESTLVLPFQKEHYFRLVDRCEKADHLLDVSIMGSGKTHSTGAVLRRLQRKRLIKHVLIVSPKSVVDVWKRHAAAIGLENVQVITYARLRGENEYLERCDPPAPAPFPPPPRWRRDEDDLEEGKFRATALWRQMVDEGTALVFDECQNLKNKTSQFRAALCLAKKLYARSRDGSGNGSKTFFLSATPIDDPKQILLYCCLFGYVKAGRLARHDIQSGYVLEGLDELVDAVVPTAAERSRYKALFYAQPRQKHQIAFDLFDQYIKRRVFFSMPAPPIETKLDIKNGLYNVSAALRDQIGAAVAQLQRGVNILGQVMNGTLPPGAQDPWTLIAASLGQIEQYKVEILSRVPLELLRSNPQARVVLVVTRRDSVARLKAIYESYGPLLLTGRQTKNRAAIFDRFNSADGPRVLIANLKVLALGVSIQDEIGNRQRFMFVVPNYFVTDMYQVARRIYRQGTKSDAVVRYVYANIPGCRETHLLTAIAKRTAAMKRATTDDLKDKVKYPTDYPDELEP